MVASGENTYGLINKIAWLKKEAIRAIEAEIDRTVGHDQLSDTELDARSMLIMTRHPRIMGCNMQSVAKLEFRLTIVQKVTNVGRNRNTFLNMANQTRRRTGAATINVAVAWSYKGPNMRRYDQ